MNKTQLKLWSKLFVGLVALAMVALPLMASAVATGGVAILPANPREDDSRTKSWFIYETDPGVEIEDAVRIRNDRDQSVIVTIDAVDAIAPGGNGFALLDKNSENPSVGALVKLESNKVTVPARSEIQVPFVITVPKDAEVGDHIGGLVMQVMEDAPTAVLRQGGATVNILTRVGARIYLTVLGDIVRDFKVLGKSFLGRSNKMILRFKVTNQGNLRANLKVDAKVYGIFGLYDKQTEMGIGEIFPKKTTTKDVIWPDKDRPLFGPYLAIATIYDTYEPMVGDNIAIPPAPKPITTWMLTFFIPYTQTIVVVILLFLIWFIRQVMIWRRLVKLARMPVVAYKVKKGDHLVDIAEEYDISWKLLAQLNELKSPYSLRNVITLYVPDSRGSQRDMSAPKFWGPLLTPLGRLVGKIKLVRKSYSTIVVEKGDKQKDIEDFTGLSWKELLDYNNLSAKSKVKVEMELKVPHRRRKR